MNKKLISVIVPIFNVEKYLPKCIESIINSTYRELEIILVDDGSVDNCGKICDEYALKDKRIVVIHRQNGGQGSARNKALDIATGEYISFVDSDDYIEPNMYDIMVSALEKTKSDIALCRFFIHSGLRTVENKEYSCEHIFDNAEQLLLGYFTGKAIGNPWNKIYKKEIWQGIRFPEGVAREDVFIMHEIYGRCARAVHTGKCLYNYVVREGSSEHQEFNTKYLISIQIADTRRDYIEKTFPNLLNYAEESCYGSRLSAIKKIVKSNAEKKYANILRELKNYIKTHLPKNKEQKRLRIKILYFPLIYKSDIFFKYRVRKIMKNILLNFKKTQ